MRFAFSNVCDLLQRLEDQICHDPPLLPACRKARSQNAIESWVRSHRNTLDTLTAPQSTALLSCLLPERRTDRVYEVQAEKLCRILCRSLGLGTARRADLEAYQVPGRGDIAKCLERVLRDGCHDANQHARQSLSITVNEIDDLLANWSSQSRFSASNSTGKGKAVCGLAKHESLQVVLLRITAEQAKWLVRIILKDLSSVNLDQDLILSSFHFLLPDLLRYQDDLMNACKLLRSILHFIPANPDTRSREQWRSRAKEIIPLSVGIKVGRPSFHKARSIAHCIKMLARRPWVLERKYDGEYCEIHIDRVNAKTACESIRIFSKSGKDSTKDRYRIHDALVSSLHLDQPDCKIKSQAILLGEMVIFSSQPTDQHAQILPFETLRKHIPRSGVYLGVENDSPVREDEVAGIVFYDVLLWDNELLLEQSIEHRRKHLKEIYSKIPGRVTSAEWKLVDFSHDDSERRLVRQFAAAIASRHEGLILKPCGAPYLTIGSHHTSSDQNYIKLKKDYIAGLGDEADLAVIGASYEAQRANNRGVKDLQWTDFHLGCLLNANDVRRYDKRPHFRHVGSIQDPTCVPAACLAALNQTGRFLASPYTPNATPDTFDLDLPLRPTVDVYFRNPMVVEVLGSGYVKSPNSDTFMLRHARIQKVHLDRSWKDTDSFDDLQRNAENARNIQEDDQIEWIKRLIGKSEKKLGKRSTFGRITTSTLGKGLRPQHSPRTKNSNSVKRKSPEDCLQQSPRLLPTSPNQRLNGKRARLFSVQSLRSGERQSLHEVNVNCGRSPENSNKTNITQEKRRDLVHSAQPSISTECSLTRRHIEDCNTAIHRKSSALQIDSGCLFCGAEIYLAPSVSTMTWVTTDLLPVHDHVLIADLKSWDCTETRHVRPASTEFEPSQVGPRRLIVVERNRQMQTESIVRLMFDLHGREWEQTVELFDWRMLIVSFSHDSDRTMLLEHRLDSEALMNNHE